MLRFSDVSRSTSVKDVNQEMCVNMALLILNLYDALGIVFHEIYDSIITPREMYAIFNIIYSYRNLKNIPNT